MQLFIYPALTDQLTALLRRQLPASVTPIFRSDLPDAAQPDALRTADALFGNPPVSWLTGLTDKLAFWQLDSAGFDKYRGVQTRAKVANMGDYFAWPCAETMIAGIMAFYRRIPELAVLQSRSEWVGAPMRQRTDLLRHKRVIILGTGTIGRAVRQMLTGFDCRVTMLARTDAQADIHSVDELRAALPETDLVINCLPGTATGFVSAEVIGAMPARCLYANVGRGSTTDEAALIDALQAGRLAGAVLDVTDTEPLPADSPLWALPNVLLTQHTGGGQPDEDQGKVEQLLRNLHRLERGEPVENEVGLGRGY
ncbi:hypothetical protein GCM10027578_24410 [Spirosoma luteolum]